MDFDSNLKIKDVLIDQVSRMNNKYETWRYECLWITGHPNTPKGSKTVILKIWCNELLVCKCKRIQHDKTKKKTLFNYDALLEEQVHLEAMVYIMDAGLTLLKNEREKLMKKHGR